MKRKNVLKNVVAIIVILLLLCMPTINFAHSGRTDANGGHKDNQNKSGLGPYHYHCGGYPAHLHEGGVCPYTSVTVQTSSTSQTSTKTSTSSTPSKVNASSVEIDEDDLELVIGELKILTATVLPSNTTDKTITWRSSDKDIVMIDAEGELKALDVGKVTITVKTINGKEDTINVTVNPIKVSEIKIDKLDVNMKVDETVVLTATVLPEDATDKTIEWTSENEEIVIVENGVIKAINPGSTKIICKSKDEIQTEVNVIVEEVNKVENTVSIDDGSNDVIEDSASTSSDSDSLGAVAALAAMIGIPVYISKKKK